MDQPKRMTTSQKIALFCFGIGILAAAWMESMDFNRTINAIISITIMGALYNGIITATAAEKIVDRDDK